MMFRKPPKLLDSYDILKGMGKSGGCMKCDKCGKEKKTLRKLYGFGFVCSDCDKRLIKKLEKKRIVAAKKLRASGYTLVGPEEE